ncbi:MAG TPA: Ig-like domain-containing protein [Longimicrobium sp.]|nr:Ig-like domain-containing protein [Longimicrobium sp.]
MPIPRISPSRLAPLALLLVLAACDEERAPSAPPPGSVPGALRVSAGDGQAGVAGAELPSEIIVEVVDAGGRPMPGVPVRFAVVAGGGQVAEAAGTSNGWGQVRTRWTLGTVAADSQVVEARVDALAPVRLRATVRPGAPASLAVTAGNGAVGPVGGALADSLAVMVKDRYGNPVAGLEVAWEAIAGGGSTSPTRTVTGADGAARTRWTLGPRVDSAQVALARVAGLDSIAFTANAVTAGVPLLLSKRGGDGQRGVVGGVLADSLGVLLRMPDGRPVAGALVSWSVPAAAGAVSPVATRTDAEGRASAAWRLGTSPGLVQATATVDSGTLVFTSLIQADAPAAMVAVAGGGEGLVGGALADSLAVRITDRHGNPVSGAEVDWSARTGGGAVSPARSATDAQGIARAQWRLGLLAGAPGQTASATVAGLPPVAFAATAGTRGVTLQLVRRSGHGQSAAAGTPLADSLVVELRTAAGEPVRGAAVAWSVAAGGGSIAPAATRTDAEGLARAAWTVGTAAGPVQASATVDEGTLAFAATVLAGAPAALRVAAGDGQSATRGTALADSLAVRVTDRHGNPVPGAPVRWRVTAGGGRVEADETRTDGDGVARVRWSVGVLLATQRAAASTGGLGEVRFSATPLPGTLVLAAVDTLARTTHTPTESVVDDTLVASLRTTDGRPVVGAPVRWFSYIRPDEPVTYTDWQGLARYHWSDTFSHQIRGFRHGRTEGQEATFKTTRPPPTYEIILGHNRPPPYYAGDTVSLTVVVIERSWAPYGAPPGLRIRVFDDSGWSIIARPSERIAWPVGERVGTRSYGACADPPDAYVKCASSATEVRPRPSAFLEQARPATPADGPRTFASWMQPLLPPAGTMPGRRPPTPVPSTFPSAAAVRRAVPATPSGR